MTDTPYLIYEAVARDRFERWGYDKTLDPEEEDAFIHSQIHDTNLRADVNLVWRLAHEHKVTG
jgi:hypothetical protein